MLMIPSLFQILNARHGFFRSGERIEGPCSLKFFLSWLHIFSVATTIGFALKEDKGWGSWKHMT